MTLLHADTANIANPPDRTFSYKMPNYQILVKKTSFIRNNHAEKTEREYYYIWRCAVKVLIF